MCEREPCTCKLKTTRLSCRESEKNRVAIVNIVKAIDMLYKLQISFIEYGSYNAKIASRINRQEYDCYINEWLNY